jgi:hypothetical protein
MGSPRWENKNTLTQIKKAFYVQELLPHGRFPGNTTPLQIVTPPFYFDLITKQNIYFISKKKIHNAWLVTGSPYLKPKIQLRKIRII